VAQPSATRPDDEEDEEKLWGMKEVLQKMTDFLSD
jgi:hypothetical protein